jgi:CheY-like chemotaxis protein
MSTDWRCCTLDSKLSVVIQGHPTILVAVDDIELRFALVTGLRAHDYLVLEAADGAGALHTLQTHSRLIHLMLTNTSLDERFMREALKRYRPEMAVMFLERRTEAGIGDVPSPETIIARVETFFER